MSETKQDYLLLPQTDKEKLMVFLGGAVVAMAIMLWILAGLMKANGISRQCSDYGVFYVNRIAYQCERMEEHE